VTSLPDCVEAKWIRTPEFGGGEFGKVNACTITYTQVPVGQISFEWNQVAILENESAVGEHCAAYFQSISHRGGQTWGVCVEARDGSNGAFYGALVGAEVNLGVCSPDPKAFRTGLHVALNQAGEAWDEGVEAGYGVRITAKHEENRRWRTGLLVTDVLHDAVSVNGPANVGPSTDRAVKVSGRFKVGIDTSDAKFDGNTAIRLGNGQQIAFEGTDTVKLKYADGKISFLWGDQVAMSLDLGSGDLYVRGKIRSGEPHDR